MDFLIGCSLVFGLSVSPLLTGCTWRWSSQWLPVSNQSREPLECTVLADPSVCTSHGGQLPPTRKTRHWGPYTPGDPQSLPGSSPLCPPNHLNTHTNTVRTNEINLKKRLSSYEKMGGTVCVKFKHLPLTCTHFSLVEVLLMMGLAFVT